MPSPQSSVIWVSKINNNNYFCTFSASHLYIHENKSFANMINFFALTFLIFSYNIYYRRKITFFWRENSFFFSKIRGRNNEKLVTSLPHPMFHSYYKSLWEIIYEFSFLWLIRTLIFLDFSLFSDWWIKMSLNVESLKLIFIFACSRTGVFYSGTETGKIWNKKVWSTCKILWHIHYFRERLFAIERSKDFSHLNSRSFWCATHWSKYGKSLKAGK